MNFFVKCVINVQAAWERATVKTTMSVETVPRYVLKQVVPPASTVWIFFVALVKNAKSVPMIIFARIVEIVQTIGKQDAPTVKLVPIAMGIVFVKAVNLSVLIVP